MRKLGSHAGGHTAIIAMWTEQQKEPQLLEPTPGKQNLEKDTSGVTSPEPLDPSIPEDLLVRLLLI